MKLKYRKLLKEQKQWSLRNPLRYDYKFITVYHCYKHKQENDFSYWDDIVFVHNGKRITVTLKHPRTDYAEQIRSLALKEAELLKPNEIKEECDTLIDKCKKIYKTVGNSRKKICGYEAYSPYKLTGLMLIQSLTEKYSEEGIEYTVKPYIKGHHFFSGIFYEVCIPFKINSEERLFFYAEAMMHYLKNGKTLSCLLNYLGIDSNYQYTKEDWLKDNQEHPQ